MAAKLASSTVSVEQHEGSRGFPGLRESTWRWFKSLWPPGIARLTAARHRGAGRVHVDHTVTIAFDTTDFRTAAQISLDLLEPTWVGSEVDRLAVVVQLFTVAAGYVICGSGLVRCNHPYTTKPCRHIRQHCLQVR